MQRYPFTLYRKGPTEGRQGKVIYSLTIRKEKQVALSHIVSNLEGHLPRDFFLTMSRESGRNPNPENKNSGTFLTSYTSC